MKTIWILERLLLCSFEIYMLYDLGKSILDVKMRKHLRLLSALLCVIAFTVINSFQDSRINLVCVPLIYLSFSILNFKGTVLKRGCVAVVYYMLAIIPEFIFAILINIESIRSESCRGYHDLDELLLIAQMKAVTFILVKIIGHIHKKRDYENLNDRIFLSLLVLPLSTIFLMVGIFYSDIHIVEAKRVVLMVGVSLLLFSNAFMFYLFDKMVDHAENAAKLENLYIKSKLENQHLQHIEKVDREYRDFMHDVKKYLRAAAELVATGSNSKALEVFSELDIKITESRHTSYCGNKILDAILTERKFKADELGIEYRVDVQQEVPVDFMANMDLISIVGNLIDNALEAAVKVCGEKYVDVNMFTQNEGHFLILEVKNNFAEAPVIGADGFITGKKNKREHGIGIHTVEKIVKKYNGKLEIKVGVNDFTASIIFQR